MDPDKQAAADAVKKAAEALNQAIRHAARLNLRCDIDILPVGDMRGPIAWQSLDVKVLAEL